jgi:hypothetical protein
MSTHRTDQTDDEFHAYWTAYLDYLARKAKGEKTAKPPNFIDGKPQGGCYEHGREREPVRIYQVDGAIYALRNNQHFTGNLNKLWLSVAKNAVTWDAYTARLETGRWPDQRSNEPQVDELEEPVPEKPLDEQLKAKTKDAEDWLAKHWPDAKKPLASLELAHEISNKAKDIRDLKPKVKELHETEKAPHKAMVDAIDAKYLKGTITPADKMLDRIKSAISVFDAAERARQQKEAEEAVAARLAEIAKFAEVSHKDVGEDEVSFAAAVVAQAQAAAPQMVEVVREATRYGTGPGRSIIARQRQIAKIVDQDLVYRHFRDNPKLGELLLDLAQAALDRSEKVPGVETENASKAS